MRISDRMRIKLKSIIELYEPLLGRTIQDGSFPESKLPALATQVYLQEKWPSHIARVYLSLDQRAVEDPTVIRYIMSIIAAENLGVGSKGMTHAALARKFAQSVGISQNALNLARPTPANQVLMDWCDMSALDRPWLDALAVHLACESQVTMMKSIAQGLRKNYAGTDITLWSIHGGPIERRHSLEGQVILARYANASNVHSILYMFEFSCKILRDFYNSFLED